MASLPILPGIHPFAFVKPERAGVVGEGRFAHLAFQAQMARLPMNHDQLGFSFEQNADHIVGDFLLQLFVAEEEDPGSYAKRERVNL